MLSNATSQRKSFCVKEVHLTPKLLLTGVYILVEVSFYIALDDGQQETGESVYTY